MHKLTTLLIISSILVGIPFAEGANSTKLKLIPKKSTPSSLGSPSYMVLHEEMKNMKLKAMISKTTGSSIHSNDQQDHGTEDPSILSLVVWFYEDLRGYVSEEGFDYYKFETSSEILRNRLCDLEFTVEAQTEHVPKLVLQIMHLRSVFQDMQDTADKLNRYERYNLPCYDLLHEICVLKIKIRMLFSIDELPDTKKEGFDEKVMLYKSIANVWEYDMTRLRGTPFGLFHSFMKQYTQVQTMLRILTSGD